MLTKKEKGYLQAVIAGLQSFVETEGKVMPAVIKEFKKAEPAEDELKKLGAGAKEFVLEGRKVFGTAVVAYTDSKVADLMWKHKIRYIGGMLVTLEKRGLVHVQTEARAGKKFIVSFNFTKI